MEYERGASGEKVVMVAVMLTLDLDAVAVAVVVARASDIRSGLRCSQAHGEEI